MLIQDLPEIWSDERMHVLDETCWCQPTIDGDYLRHHPPETYEVRDGLGNLIKIKQARGG